MEKDKVQLIRSFAEAYTAAWCSQDAARVAAFYEENGSLSVNEDAPAVGRQAITEVAGLISNSRGRFDSVEYRRQLGL